MAATPLNPLTTKGSDVFLDTLNALLAILGKA